MYHNDAYLSAAFVLAIASSGKWNHLYTGTQELYYLQYVALYTTEYSIVCFFRPRTVLSTRKSPVVHYSACRSWQRVSMNEDLLKLVHLI